MAVAFSHPARIHAVACAHGLVGAAFGPAFSYLAIDAVDAANLLPLAARFPEARFVGVVIDPTRRARAHDDVERCGLSNLTLVASAPDARFDYVVAHGIYSWIDDAARDALVAQAASRLATHGVALVSYNTLPGWSLRGVLRELMMSAATGDDHEERVIAARSAAAKLERHLGAHDHPYRALLHAELSLVQRKSDAELCDDDLAEHNHAVTFETFVAHAAQHGLSYLGEMLPATPDGALESDALPRMMQEGLSRVRAEQYLDVLSYRQLRATLLCHASATIRPRPDDRALLEDGFVSARLEPQAAEPLLAPGRTLAFATPRGALIEVERPLLKAALLALAEEWPAGFSLRELMSKAVEQLKLRDLVDAANVNDAEITASTVDIATLVRRRQLELTSWRPLLRRDIPATPRVHAVTLLEAERGPHVTHARHEPIELDDVARAVFRLLDGSRDYVALRAAVARRLEGGALRLDDVPAARRDDVVAELVMQAVVVARNLGLLCDDPKA